MKDILEGNSNIIELLIEAKKLKEANFGRRIETCAILNAKSGKCPSNCKFCAQSSYHKIKIKEYPLLEENFLLSEAEKMFCIGVNRFSIVTSGISVYSKEIKLLGNVIEKLASKGMKVCASLGQLGKVDLKFLKDWGLARYLHYFETSKEYYPEVSSIQ